MTEPSVTPDRPPRNVLSAPESDELPLAGIERRSGVLSGPQTGSQGLDPAPVQLTLPEALLAAMRIPDAVPSARRRGRPVHSTPDIDRYQPKENPA